MYVRDFSPRLFPGIAWSVTHKQGFIQHLNVAGGQQERGLPWPLQSGGHSAVGSGQPCEAVSSRAGM